MSGLTLQRFLEQDSEILEKEDRIGGLCRTFSKDGFRYDIGGHILFSKDKDYLPFVRELLQTNIRRCKRTNKVLFKGRYVKYPFENGLGELEKEDTYDCLNGFLTNSAPEPSNFKEWMYHTFGRGITEKYLLPYNEKIWKYPLDQMSMGWVERVPKPPVEDVVKSALGIETEGYVHQLYFDYPAVGGIEALPLAMRKQSASIKTNFQVRAIRKSGHEWIVSNGDEDRRYHKLVLTIPLDQSIACMEGVPPEVRSAVSNLRYNSVRIVLVGINRDSLLDKTAIYVPDPSILAHRMCFMGYFSRSMVPEGRSSLMVEISAPPGHPTSQMSDASILQRVVDDCHSLGILDSKDVIATDVQNIQYGYVIYDLHYQRNMAIVRKYFSGLGIDLLGRFAEFEYINLDEVIRRARKKACDLNQNDPT